MGHSIGDGIIVTALAAAFVGYLYFKHRTKQRRLELLHAERLAAMDKGIPLPELPLDPPPVAPHERNPNVLLIPGFILIAVGGGSMIAFSLVDRIHHLWPLPLPVALMGLGFVLYRFLIRDRPK